MRAVGSMLQSFEGISFIVDQKPFIVSEHFELRGRALDNVPNFSYKYGYYHVSSTLCIDLSSMFICNLLNMMKMQGASVATPHSRQGLCADKEPIKIKKRDIVQGSHNLPLPKHENLE